MIQNIWAINNFFTSRYFAMQLAMQQASQDIADMGLTIDPDQKTNFVLDDILTALTIGLAFLSAVPDATEATGALMLGAIAQALTLGKTTLPDWNHKLPTRLHWGTPQPIRLH